MSQTNGRATSESPAKPTAADRQPSSGISPAASGRASATPMPGPAYATPRARPVAPAYLRAIAVVVPTKTSCSPSASKTPYAAMRNATSVAVEATAQPTANNSPPTNSKVRSLKTS